MTPTPPQLDVYVISLTRSAPRRARIAARLQELGLGFQFFDAVEGALQTPAAIAPFYDGRRRRLFFGRDLTASEIGCLMSHCGVYQRVVDNTAPLALILEDDALLQDTLPAVLRVIQKQHAAGDGFDLWRFLGAGKTPKVLRPLQRLHLDAAHSGATVARVYGTPGGAYGYVVTQDAAARLLQAAQRGFVPVDTIHGQMWRTGIDAAAVWPSPVMPDYDIASTMPDARFDKTRHLTGLEKPLYPFTRFAWKMYEAFFKNIDALRLWWRDRNRFAGARPPLDPRQPFSSIQKP